MENIVLYFSLALLSILVVRYFLARSSSRRNLPPSPAFRLPIIGHLHLLGRPAQHAFKKLADKYGPVYSLRFGSRLVVIVTSPEAVKECFTKNDVVLAARPLLNSGKYMAYDNTIFAAASYGEHWRNLRRIGSIEIYSPTRLNKFLDSRSDEVKRLLRQLGTAAAAAGGFSRVKMEPIFAELTFNIVMRMVAGKSYFGENVSNEEEAKNFRYIMKEIFMISEASSPGDFIPIWNWIDPTGHEKKLKNIAKKVDVFLVDLIEEIRNRKGEGNTMVDHLLSMQISEPQFFSDQIIKGLIWVIMLAGTDTQSGTLTWTMSHLLNNLEVLKKAKAEIDTVVGRERLVEENDLSKLTYLQHVIAETLRLNPLPLLLPHCASEDCTIQGYHIPRDTMLLFNVWAIHRDPKLWDDALTFKPERHANLTIEDQYKYLPFGLGRRACPGGGMANRVVGLALASMIQCFEWKRVSDELVDMTVGNGITASRAFPLEAMCKPWPSMERVLVEEVGFVRK